MRRDIIQNEYMFDTSVENIFINEYMIGAPDNFVKVYLLSLMYADLNKEMTDEKIAKILGIDIDDVSRAWKYWQELEVIKRVNGEIVFPQLKEKIYGTKKIKKATEETSENKINFTEQSLHMLDNKALRNMFKDIESILHRTLSGAETEKVLDLIDMYGANPEVITYAYEYCVSRKKESVNYISRVVEAWIGKGFKNRIQIEEFLEETDQRHYMYKRVLKALGFSRNATEEEKRIMDVWFDEYNLSIDKILNACKKTSGISNPNFNYVNSVLIGNRKESSKKSEKGQISRKHIMEYYEYIRQKAEDTAKEHRKEIIEKIPEIAKLDEKKDENYIKLTKLAISGGEDKIDQMRILREENDNIEFKINEILARNNIPQDYMQIKYKCPICKDTGSREDGQQCSCYLERAKEAENWTK